MSEKKLLKCILSISVALVTVLSAAGFSVYANGNAEPSAPAGLLTNELECPLNTEDVSFFWLPQDSDRNEIQTAYQIVVTDGITDETVWDSGKVQSDEQSNVRYGGDKLKSGYPYKWKVKTWDKDDAESPFSEEKEFASGIPDEDWNAYWISAGTGSTGKNVYRHMRRQVSLDSSKTVSRALAYAACCHDYELNINGERIGRGQSFDYADKTDYQGWDITEAVGESGEIAVGITARWYGAGQGRAAEQAGLMVKINVYYTDGTMQSIVSDEEWKTTTTPYFGTLNRNGEGDFVEQYNAQNEKDGWTEIGYDDSSWGAVTVLGAHPAEPFTHVEPELGHVTEIPVKPVSVEKLSNGDTVVDFGRIIPARVSVRFVNGTAGRVVNLQAGYELNSDGSVNTSKTSLQNTDMRFAYTQKDGEQVYNTWDHLAFQYVQIPECGEDFTIDDIEGKIVRAEVADERETTFTSSDEMLNRVYELMKNSALFSTQNTFVDTPTREKGQFLDDSRNISAVTMTAWYERATSKKGILQFLDSADRYWNSGDDLGRYNAVYPNGDGKRDIPDYSVNMPYWVWTYYMQTGDKELLKYAYPYMKNTAIYIENAISSQTGLVTALPGGSSSYEQGIVDWPAVGRFSYDWDGTKDGARTTINALSVRALNTIADMAAELDDNDAESMYRKKAEELKTAMNNRLINADGVYCDGLTSSGEQSVHAGQHSTSYALAFGIAPEDKINEMSEYVASMGMKQGPMTADMLIEGLFNSGNAKGALDILTNTSDNGWAKLVDAGYTFTWEAWVSNESKSHGWGAAAAKTIIENLIGVKVTGAGAEQIEIDPAYGIIDSLSGSVMTERGRVGIEYSGKLGDYRLKVDIPVNVEATVCFPVIGNGEFVCADGTKLENCIENDKQLVTLGSGGYEFIYEGEVFSAVKIDNPENINAYAEIDGERYSLPMKDFVKVEDTDGFRIASDDVNYEFAYFNGDIVTSDVKTAVTEGKESAVSAHFKYVSQENDSAVLRVNGEGNIRVNGEIKPLPYSENFEKGAEIVIEGAPTENKIFEGFTNGVIGNPAIIVLNGEVETTAKFRENGENKNVSQGILATATDSLENDSWGIARLTDGVLTGTGYTSDTKYDSGADVSADKPYVMLDLGESTVIDRVIFYPRTDAQANKDNHYMFPQDFYIETSEDGKNFTTAAGVSGATDDDMPDTVDFQPVRARYVRVTFTKLCESTGTLGSRRLQLAELEVYSGANKLNSADTVSLDKAEINIEMGESAELNAAVMPLDTSFKNIEWLVQDENGQLSDIAYITFEDNTAVIHASKEGSAYITARATDGFGAAGRCILNIEETELEIEVEKLSDAKYEISLPGLAGTLITAQYDENNELINIECNEIEAEQKKIIKEINADTCKVKFMLWNSVNEMFPLTDAVSLTVHTQQ